MAAPIHPLTPLTSGAMVAERYTIVALIGAGGTGMVYAALDTRTGQTVALKQVPLLNAASERAFLREVELLQRLRHPHLPVFYAHSADTTGHFLVMEYIPGEDLATLLARQRTPFAPRLVLAWADTLLELLELLHTQRPPVIHRDIKPQNLKLTPDGRLVLVDFGLARTVLPDRTATPTVVGYTLAYAPIEQIQGGTAGPRDDLYAVGATLYHLVAGVPPADALVRAAATINGQPDPLVPLGQFNPALPAALVTTIHAAMALRLDDRLASAGAMRMALTALQHTGYTGETVVIRDRQPGPALPQPALAPPVRLLLGAGILAVCVALVLLIWRPLAGSLAPPPPISAPTVEAIVPLDTSLVRAVVPLPALGAALDPAQRVAFSPDGRVLAAALQTGRILLWNAQDRSASPRELAGGRWIVEALAFSPDSTILAVGDGEGRVRLWRVPDGQPIATLRKHYQGVTALAFSPDSKILATASTDDTVRLWDLATGHMVEGESYYHELTAQTIATYSMAFAADGKTLFLGLADGSIIRRDLDERQDVQRVEAHTGPVVGLTLSPDGRTLASTGGMALRLWRTDDLTSTQSITLGDTVSGAALYDPDGRVLTVAAGNIATIWAITDGKLLFQLDVGASAHGLALAPDGRILVAATSSERLPVWELTFTH